ncbi:transposase [Candidatus Chloroploca asiatica]|nr:transposase [Candidatus Chloroploca asiatica]
MTRLPGLSQWNDMVSTHLPHLTRPQTWGLTCWSMGIIVAQRAGLLMVAVVMAALLDRTVTATRGCLRDWYLDGKDKQGAKHGSKRRTLEVASCFAPLLRWVIHLSPAGTHQIALAMDASTLGQRFTVLSIHVVIRGCAIPIAWKIVRATAQGAWRPHWETLFQDLTGSTPDGWTVIVLADRGLYAKWLYDAIQKNGWHPYLRINRQGKYRPVEATEFRGLSTVVVKGEAGWKGRVVCFATAQRQVTCTLLARWTPGYTDPWLVLTDLPPEEADVAWYGLRAWIECSYKDMKRGGWHWEQTKMTDPARAERLWLAMALATLLVVSVGVHAEATTPQPVLDDLPDTHIARRRKGDTPPRRQISCFHRGRLLVLVAFAHGRRLPPMALIPEPWPESLDTSHDTPAAAAPHQKAA